MSRLTVMSGKTNDGVMEKNAEERQIFTDLAKFKGKIVAIKEFPSTDGESFTRESRIYTSLMLCHQVCLLSQFSEFQSNFRIY